MERILITTDLSRMKSEIMRVGFEYARKTGAGVDLLTVINRNLDFFPADTGMAFTDQWEARQYYAQQELEAIPDVEQVFMRIGADAHGPLPYKTLAAPDDPANGHVDEDTAPK